MVPPLLAFAGIGRPADLFRSILSAGGNLVRQIAFADHHPYSQLDLARLQEDAHRHGADLITTQKDWMRLPADWRGAMAMLPVTLEIDQDGGLLARVGTAPTPDRRARPMADPLGKIALRWAQDGC